MALVVFLRGINVGGHRRFRPSVLAKELCGFDAVNVGGAGTLVVFRPGSRTKLRLELVRKLPFEAEIVICEGRDILHLEKNNPFGIEEPHPGRVRIVSILSKDRQCTTAIPLRLPPEGEWFVSVLAKKQQFVCGVYRGCRPRDSGWRLWWDTARLGRVQPAARGGSLPSDYCESPLNV
jgi:hypothetical protein